MQKMWPSSWVKPRTRIRPCSAPEGSSVAGAEFAVAQRQVAVAAHPLVVDLMWGSYQSPRSRVPDEENMFSR